MPANLENSAVATGLEKVSFHSNPKERQCKECANYRTIALISQSGLGPRAPWTSESPARYLPHTFGSHIPPSPSHITASTVIRCPSPCPEPRERTESRNYWEWHASCPRQGLGWHHVGITEFKPQITCYVTVAYSFSQGSTWPRNQTGVFCIAGGFLPAKPVPLAVVSLDSR